MPYSLFLKKENFKFSSSHFTIFSSTSAEALHGHNYSVEVNVEFNDIDPSTELKFDFNEIKKVVREHCELMDEKILIPQHSPFLKIQTSPTHKNHTEVLYGERFYCFPSNEVQLLPIANITTEALARYLHSCFLPKFPKAIQKISVTVGETAGQSATYN